MFKDSPANSMVLVGYPMSQRCSVRDPAPPSNILWLKDSIMVTPDSRISTTYDATAGDSQLRITSVSYVNAGQCVAVGSSNEILVYVHAIVSVSDGI